MSRTRPLIDHRLLASCPLAERDCVRLLESFFKDWMENMAAKRSSVQVEDLANDFDDSDYPPADGRWVPSRGIYKQRSRHTPYSEGGMPYHFMTRQAGEKIEIAVHFDPVYLFEKRTGIPYTEPEPLDPEWVSSLTVQPPPPPQPRGTSNATSQPGRARPSRMAEAEAAKTLPSRTRRARAARDTPPTTPPDRTSAASNAGSAATSTAARKVPIENRHPLLTQLGTRSLGRNARRRRARENRASAEGGDGAQAGGGVEVEPGVEMEKLAEGVRCVEID